MRQNRRTMTPDPAVPSSAVKIPQSVLVVIHTPAFEVLLIRRADAAEFWQSVTGSKDHAGEAFAETAAREVLEETGIDCRPGSALAAQLRDWHLENVYDIYPAWRHRYAPGVTRNTEHLFSLCGWTLASTRKAAGCPGAPPQRRVIRPPMPRPS
jgi:8-oxo-dGTP pyrophosphatase MutT (NUDIX family)